jgi:hypothetical protein
MLTPLYSCDKALKTPEHVLLHCNKIAKKTTMRQRIAPIALRIRRNLA